MTAGEALFGRDVAARADAVLAALACLDRASRDDPFSGASPERLAALADAIEVLPEEGRPLEAVLADVGDLAVGHAVDPAHPACAGHLHCPPLNAALAADLLVSATNPSLDSWDQAPMATHLEGRIVRTLCAAVGFGAGADGVFTTGGTQSNLMGLLLARDRTLAARGHDVAADGLGREGGRLRILCSTLAHFTVQRSAALLGLGTSAVVPVPVDSEGHMSPDALDTALSRLADDGSIPAAIVATAGTTDLGAVDPLSAVADRAAEHGAWLHVDAAYGGALLFSDRHRYLLDGIARADSVAVDFHKLLWQPVACGAFLVRDCSAFAPIDVEVAYLNADEGTEAWRMPHLLGKSLQTTRRFDALKVLVTFQSLGRRALAALIDRTLDLAQHAADLIAAEPALQLVQRPTLTTVVFRYRADDPERSDRLNTALRLRLLADGEAVIGRTEFDGRIHLKLTLLNPTATEEDLAMLVTAIARTGQGLESRMLSRLT